MAQSKKAAAAKPEEITAADAVEVPAIFDQAHHGFLLRRADWQPHEYITGDGQGGYVDWKGEARLLSPEDLTATWSVK